MAVNRLIDPNVKKCVHLLYDVNIEQNRARGRAYQKAHAKEHSEYNRKYYSIPKNRERRTFLNKQPARKAKSNAYDRERRKNNPALRLRHNISTNIAHVLAGRKSRKIGSFLKAVPYTMQELKIHLELQFEPWMNWNNYGKHYRASSWDDNDPSTWGWQLDHIIPQSDLPYTSMLEDNFKKCWALDNLRPLSSKQNLLDGVQRVRHKF